MSIVATCSCGESFGAPVSMAGKKARCPSCGEVLEIPESAQQIEDEIDDEFEDDDLEEEDSTEALLEDALTEGGQRVDSILPIEAEPATEIHRKPSVNRSSPKTTTRDIQPQNPTKTSRPSGPSAQNKARSSSQRAPAQRSTAQGSTAQGSTAQGSTAQRKPAAPGNPATSKGDATTGGAKAGGTTAGGTTAGGTTKSHPAKKANPNSASAKASGGKATPAKTQSKNPHRSGVIDRKTAPAIRAKPEPVVALQKPGGNAADLGTNDVFDLGDLSSLESPQPDPLAQPSPSQSAARPAPAPQAAHWNTPQQAPPKSNLGLILGIVGGGVAVVLVAVVAGVVVILMSQGNDNDGGGDQVAQNNTSTTTDQPSGSANGGSQGGGASNNGNGQFGDNRFGAGANVGPLGPGGRSGTGFGGSDSNTTDDINRFGRDDDDVDSGDADTTDSGDGGFGGSGDVTDASMIQASNNWHSQVGRRLRGTIEVPDVDLVIYRYSWLCELLPHMGYQDVHDKLDFDQMFIELSNRPASETIIPQFLNPLDDRERCSDIRFPDFALTHFAGMSGVEDLPNDLAAEYPRSHPLAGIFGYNEIAQPDDITDGLGETIMIVGTGRIVQPWVAGGGATIRGARPPYFGKFNGLGSVGLPRPGVIVVFADGTIRHISADIDPKVFKALCTIHGAESVDMNHEAIGQPSEDWFNR